MSPRLRRRVMTWSIGLGTLALLGSVLLYRSSQRDIRAAYQRLDARQPLQVETACGTIEYAVQGEGDPVLVVHGIAGGFDQALDAAADHLGPGFSVIAPSRFGYLGTPMPTDATPGSQADALACLLHHLQIDRAGVMAYSAGGASAIQLALRHPERVAALVLLSTAPSAAEGEVGLPPRPLIEAILHSDFALWLLTHPLRPLMQPMVGVPSDYRLTDADQLAVAELMGSILPIEPRAEGHVFDMFTTNTDQARHPDRYPLERIAAPTLLVNAIDDPLASHTAAEQASRRIPDARLVSIPRGGHVFLSNADLVRQEVTDFLTESFAPVGAPPPSRRDGERTNGWCPQGDSNP